ncbi:MAG: hypothetical protein JO313_17170, partial [Verrucomicrobia bacterium]|nr:hypothetical protein [Verrucomicrobiota bacterium]
TAGRENTEKLPAKLSSRHEALFRRLTGNSAAVAWAVPCVSGPGKYLEPNRFGYLLASDEAPSNLWFITKSTFGSASKMLEIEQLKVSLERRLLFEELNLYSPGKNRRFTFRFDRGSTGLADRVAAELEHRLDTATELKDEGNESSAVAGVPELQKEEIT